MKSAITSYFGAERMPVPFIVAMWLLVAPALAQSPNTGQGPILTFSPGIASTIAGTGASGYSGDGGPATSAQLNTPVGIARDSQNNLYVADLANNVIRKIGSDGTISTVAGNGTQGYSGDGGPATNAQLAFPIAVALDGGGNLYIADYFNLCIRKVDTNGTISTFVTTAGFLVRSLVADATGNVYFSGSQEGVWKVDSMGVTTRIAGNGQPGFSGDGGPATEAQTFGVAGLAVDSLGNLYLAETYNNDVRKVDVNGFITTVAGNQQLGYSGDDGPATSARLNTPSDVRVDAAGNLYIADTNNGRIRKVNANGTISTIAGDGNFAYAGDGRLATAAEFAGPKGLELDANGSLSVADTGNNVIRKVKMDSTTLDFGTVTVGQIGGPIRVTLSNAGSANLNVSSAVTSNSFGIQTTCLANSPLSPGSDCTVDVSFIPVVSGNISGAVTVSDNAAGNPHTINLTGQGYVIPIASKLVFATQFSSQPLNGNTGVVVVNATDSSGNLATGFNGTVSLQLRGPAGFTTYNTQMNASSGSATFNLTSIALNAAGSYTITASSSGLTSAQASFSVIGNADFAVSTSAASLTVGQSSAATNSVTLIPSNGFSGSITLSCSGLPSHSKCSFSPASLLADGSNSALSSVVTISTGVATVASAQHSDRTTFVATGSGIFGASLFTLVFAPIAGRRKTEGRSNRFLQRMFIAVILCGSLIGCGAIGSGDSHLTPKGSYTVTVTGTSTGIAHSSAFTLVVQ